MFRAIFLWAMLLFAVAPQGASAQAIDEKPTQILPERENLPPESSSSDVVRKPSLEIIADTPLVDDDEIAGAGGFVIAAIRIEDAGLLPQSAYGEVSESFIGRNGNRAELQNLTKAIADRVRQSGYIFASAMIPAQSVKMGIVRVRVDAGTVDKVVVKGADNRRVNRLFQTLKGRPGRKSEIERTILVANDYPGISVDKTRFRRKNGKGIFTIDVSEIADQIRLTIDNYGSRDLGPARARLEVDRHGVFGGNDWLSTQVLTTPINPKQLTFISSRYSNILTDDGKMFSVTGAAGRTRQHRDDGGVISKSRSRYAAAKLSLPIIKSGRADIALNMEAAFLSVDRVSSNGRLRNDDIASITASATGYGKFVGGRASGGITATRGLDILGATGANDPNSSRRDGSGQFTKGEIWLNWTRKLGKGYSFKTAVSGQVASRPLLSSQEIDLGGPRFGRGFDFSERSGDQGVLASFELRKFISKPVKHVSSAQFYAFADGGYVDNLRNGRGGGSLMSAGGGVRASFGKIDLSLEMALPVKGKRENGGGSPQLNAAIGFSF